MRKNNERKSIHNIKKRSLALTLALLMLVTTLQLDSQSLTAIATEEQNGAAAENLTEEESTATDDAAAVGTSENTNESAAEAEPAVAEENTGSSESDVETTYNNEEAAVTDQEADSANADTNGAEATGSDSVNTDGAIAEEAGAEDKANEDIEKANGEAEKADPITDEANTENSGNAEADKSKTDEVITEYHDDTNAATDKNRSDITEETESKNEETDEGDQPANKKKQEEEVNKTEEPNMPANEHKDKTPSGIEVNVSYDKGVFPEGTEMVVADVAKSEALEAAKDAIEDDSTEVKVKDAVAVDITFYYKGEEIQPKGKVNVKIEPRRALKEGDEVAVVHVSDEGEATEVKEKDIEEATEEKAEFTAEEFSVWVLATIEVETPLYTVSITGNASGEITDQSEEIILAEEDGKSYIRNFGPSTEEVNSGGQIATVFVSDSKYDVPKKLSYCYLVPKGVKVRATVELYQNLTNITKPTSGEKVYTLDEYTLGSTSSTTDNVYEVTVNLPSVAYVNEDETLAAVLKFSASGSNVIVYGYNGSVEATDKSYVNSSGNGFSETGTTCVYIERESKSIGSTKDINITITDDKTETTAASQHGMAQGTTLQLEAKFDKKISRDVTWSIAEGSSATVNATGLVTAKDDASGLVKVRAIADGANAVDYSINVLKPTLSPATPTYQGKDKPIKPTITLKGGSGGTSSYDVTNGSNYEVSYGDNNTAGANKGTVTITALNTQTNRNANTVGYTETVKFDIAAFDMSVVNGDKTKISAININTSTNTVTSATIKHNDSVLTLGTDFDMALTNKTITGNGTLTYDIAITTTNTTDCTGSATITGYTYTAGSGGGSLTELSSVLELDTAVGTVVYDPLDPKSTEDALLALVSKTYPEAADEAQVKSDIQSKKITITLTHLDGSVLTEFTGDVGTYTVTAAAVGSAYYTGSVTTEVELEPFPLESATLELALSEEDEPSSAPLVAKHTGKAIEPIVQLKKGDNVFYHSVTQTSSDISISYSSNIKVGTARINILGDGNFSGGLYPNFDIIPDFNNGTLTVSVQGASKFYPTTVSTITENGVDIHVFTVKDTAAFAKEVIYNGAAHNQNVTVKYGNTKLTGTYETIYTDDDAAAKGITGTHLDVTNAGTATFIITGKASTLYEKAGYVYVAFPIAPKDINDNTIAVTPPADKTYNGKVQKPTDFTVKDGVTSLAADTHYTVAYTDDKNTDVTDSAEIVLTGTGNYSGTRTVNFKIEPLDLNSGTFKARILDKSKQKPYTGNEIKLRSETIQDQDQDKYDYAVTYELEEYTETLLIEGTDYEAIYVGDTTEVTESGVISVNIKGIGNYTGTVNYSSAADAPNQVAYKIVSVSIENLEYYMLDENLKFVAVKKVDEDEGLYETHLMYDGTAQKPAVRVKYGDNILEANDDYTITWANNTNQTNGIASGTITITGKPSGTHRFKAETYTIKFYIDKRSLTTKDSSGKTVLRSDVTLDYNSGTGKFTVRDNGLKSVQKTLTEGAENDYTIAFDPIVYAGTHAVTIAGKGNFEGEATASYITGTDISTAISPMNPSAAGTGRIRIKINDTAAAWDPENQRFSIPYMGTSSNNYAVTLTDTQSGDYVLMPKVGNAAGDYTIEYTPATNYARDSEVTVKITADNVGAKYYGTYTFKFYIATNQDPNLDKIYIIDANALKGSNGDNGSIEYWYTYAGKDNDIPFSFTVNDSEYQSGTVRIKSVELQDITINDNTEARTIATYEYGDGGTERATGVIPVSTFADANAGISDVDILENKRYQYVFTLVDTNNNYKFTTAKKNRFFLKRITLNAYDDATGTFVQIDGDTNNYVSVSGWDTNPLIKSYGDETPALDDVKLTVTYGGSTKKEVPKSYYNVTYDPVPATPAVPGDYHVHFTTKDATKAVLNNYTGNDHILRVTKKQISMNDLIWVSDVNGTTKDFTNANQGTDVTLAYKATGEAVPTAIATVATDWEGTDKNPGSAEAKVTVTLVDSDNYELLDYTGTSVDSVDFNTKPTFKIIGDLSSNYATFNAVPATLYLGNKTTSTKLYTNSAETVEYTDADIVIYFNGSVLDPSNYTITAISDNATSPTSLVPGAKVTLTITGKGDYYIGTKTKTETIPVMGFLDDAVINGVKESYAYTGDPIEESNLTVSVSYGNVQIGETNFNTSPKVAMLIPDTDCTVYFKDDDHTDVLPSPKEIKLGKKDGSNYILLDEVNPPSCTFKIEYDLSKVTFTATLSGVDTPWELDGRSGAYDVPGITGRNVSYSKFTSINITNVKIGGMDLSAATDYTISFANTSGTTLYTVTDTTPISGAAAALTAQGTGTYYIVLTSKGTKMKAGVEVRKPFNIISGSFSATPPSNSNISVQYTGRAVTGEKIHNADIARAAESRMVIKNDNDVALVYGTDYKIEDTSNVNATSDYNAYYTIVGINNYEGKRLPNVQFTITPKPITDSTITITVPRYYYTGQEIIPEPVITDSDCQATLVLDTDYTLDENNKRTAVTPQNSTYTLKLTGIGNYSGSKDDVPWAIERLSFTNNTDITLSKESVPYTGEAYDATSMGLKVKLVTMSSTGERTEQELNPSQYTVSFSPRDVREVGAYSVTISASNSSYYTGSTTRSFNVVQRSLTDAEYGADKITVSIDNENWAYTGSAVEPNVTVVDTGVSRVYNVTTGGSYTLVKGKDYSVTYTNNINSGSKDDETAPPTVTISGMGVYYGGTVTKTFTIGNALGTAELTDGTLVAGVKCYTYNYGNEIKPRVQVKNTGGTTLTEGVDYSVEYINNINTAAHDSTNPPTVKITGIGKYYGTLTKNFTILARDVTPTAKVSGTYYYTSRKVEPAVTVKVGSTVLTEGVDYEIYNLPGYDCITAMEQKVGIRALPGTNYNFADFESESFTIKPLDISSVGKLTLIDEIEGYADAYFYNGTEKVPNGDVTVTGIDGTLAKDIDVEFTYANNVNIGDEATITVKGIGNYSGSFKKNFKIYANLADAEITIKNQFYTGSAITPAADDITVTFPNGYQLSPKLYTTTDTTGNFRISANSGESAVDSHVTITFAGVPTAWYYGTQTGSFDITANVEDISVYYKDVTPNDGKLLVTESNGIVPYTGSEIKPTFTLKSGDKDLTGIATIGEISYTAVNNDFTSGGSEVKVAIPITLNDGTRRTVYPKANNGTPEGASYTYKIGSKNLADDDVQIFLSNGAEEKADFTGSAIKPKVTVICSDKVLNEGTDYKVTYENNIAPGRKTPGGALITKAVAKISSGTNRNYFVDANPATAEEEPITNNTFEIVMTKVAKLEAVVDAVAGLSGSFDDAAGATGYKIEVKNASGSTVLTQNTPNNTFAAANIKSANNYEVVVTAYYKKNENDDESDWYWGEPVSCSVKISAVSPQIDEDGSGSTEIKTATVKWAKGDYNGIEIYRATSVNGTYKRIADVPASTTSFTDKSQVLKSGKTYYYKTRAYTISGGRIDYAKSYSDPVAITVK